MKRRYKSKRSKRKSKRSYKKRRVTKYEAAKPISRITSGPISKLCCRFRLADIVAPGTSGVTTLSRNYTFNLPVQVTGVQGWDYLCIRGIKVTFTQVVDTSAQAAGANTRNPTIYLVPDFDLANNDTSTNTFDTMSRRGCKQRALLPNKPVSIYFTPTVCMLDTIAGSTGATYATTIKDKVWIDNLDSINNIWSGLRVFMEDMMAGIHTVHVDVRAWVRLKGRT